VTGDSRDYKLEISSLRPVEPTAGAGVRNRPWVSILFKCCSVYQRVYRSADGTRYAGRCPKCGRPVKLAVGSGGTDARFFTAE
jgi:hypothetical protein